MSSVARAAGRIRRFVDKRTAQVRRTIGLPPARYRPALQSRRFGIHLDSVERPDARSVVAMGWLWDPNEVLDRIEVVSGSGAGEAQRVSFFREDLLNRFDAADGSLGLALFAENQEEHDESGAVAFDVVLKDHRVWRLRVGTPTPCPFDTRDRLIERLPALTGTELGIESMRSALGRTMARGRREQGPRSQWVVGELPARPEVSAVIPLFGNPDLLEAQISAFARDRWLVDCAELIYVVDDPRQEAAIHRLSQDLHALYSVPARFMAMPKNCGYGLASNAGAAEARAERLLLLNSDVIPHEAGWLEALLAEADRWPDAGILAPTLVYEDGSIQHAGLYWAPDRVRIYEQRGQTRDVEIWKNHQFSKGYPASLHPATREVPAVATACALMPTALFRELDGFDEVFLHGDCEDSELCLRIARRGRRILHAGGIALLHLEGQSYPDALRRQVSVYNNWLQDRMWRDDMIERMRHYRDGACRSNRP